MMQVVPLDRLLLQVLVENERDPLVAEMCTKTGFGDRALASASRGLAHVLLVDGFPVIGMGLTPAWHGLAEGWALVSKDARQRHIVKATRAAAHWLDLRQRDPAFRRVEIYCRADMDWTLSFAHALGFNDEGYLPRRDPAGRDQVLFARVREAV